MIKTIFWTSQNNYSRLGDRILRVNLMGSNNNEYKVIPVCVVGEFIAISVVANDLLVSERLGRAFGLSDVRNFWLTASPLLFLPFPLKAKVIILTAASYSFFSILTFFNIFSISFPFFIHYLNVTHWTWFTFFIVQIYAVIVARLEITRPIVFSFSSMDSWVYILLEPERFYLQAGVHRPPPFRNFSHITVTWHPS